MQYDPTKIDVTIHPCKRNNKKDLPPIANITQIQIRSIL
jgi:hypothetical protein